MITNMTFKILQEILKLNKNSISYCAVYYEYECLIRLFVLTWDWLQLQLVVWLFLGIMKHHLQIQLCFILAGCHIWPRRHACCWYDSGWANYIGWRPRCNGCIKQKCLQYGNICVEGFIYIHILRKSQNNGSIQMEMVTESGWLRERDMIHLTYRLYSDASCFSCAGFC